MVGEWKSEGIENILIPKKKKITKEKKKKKKKKRRATDWTSPCALGIFVIYLSNSSHSVFSPFWRENILVGLERKHLGPTNFFSLPFLQPNTHQNFFLPFSLQSFPSTLFYHQTNTP